MLLGDADIEITLGIDFGKPHHPRAFAHRRRDTDQTVVEFGHVAQPVAEYLGVGRLAAALAADDAVVRLEFRHPVIQHRVCFRQLVTLAFARDHVQELRSLQLADVFQRRNQRVEIVAVDRPDVVEAEFLEQGAGRHHALYVFLGAPREFPEHLGAGAPRGGVKAPRHQLRQILVERADRRRNRHVVVVEDHQQIGVGRSGVVERLVRHPGGHRAVADDRHRVTLDAGEPGCDRHAQRGADRGARMRGAEGVVFAFLAPRKARYAFPHA